MISAQDPIGTICFGYHWISDTCTWFTALGELTQQFWGCSQCTAPWKNSATSTPLGITLQLLISGGKKHTHTVSEKLRNRPTINGKYFIPLHHLVWHTVIDVSRDHGGTIWRVGQTKDASAHPTTRRKPWVPPAKSVCRLHASQSSRRCYRTSTATCAPAFQLAQQHRLSWHAGHEAVAVMILRNVYNYVPFDTA